MLPKVLSSISLVIVDSQVSSWIKKVVGSITSMSCIRASLKEVADDMSKVGPDEVQKRKT